MMPMFINKTGATVFCLTIVFLLLNVPNCNGEEARASPYVLVKDPNLGMSNPTIVSMDISLINCASFCAASTGCSSFAWDSSDTSCTIGLYANPRGSLFSSSSRTIFTRPHKCRFDLGFEIRFHDGVSRCLYKSRTEMTQQGGKKECHKNGGRLFKANSDKLIFMLANFAVEEGISFQGNFYIGLEYVAADNTFVWSDGQPFTKEEKSAVWKRMYKSDGCVAYSTFYGDLGHESCWKKRQYICEMDME